MSTDTRRTSYIKLQGCIQVDHRTPRHRNGHDSALHHVSNYSYVRVSDIIELCSLAGSARLSVSVDRDEYEDNKRSPDYFTKPIRHNVTGYFKYVTTTEVVVATHAIGSASYPRTMITGLYVREAIEDLRARIDAIEFSAADAQPQAPDQLVLEIAALSDKFVLGISVDGTVDQHHNRAGRGTEGRKNETSQSRRRHWMVANVDDPDCYFGRSSISSLASSIPIHPATSPAFTMTRRCLRC